MRLSAAAVMLALSAWSFEGAAQLQPVPNARAPQRLSSWLLEQNAQSGAYYTGLSWRVPEEQPAQLSLKLELLATLENLPTSGGSGSRGGGLAALLSAMPVTGRVPVASGDARWLEANPQRDPLLLPGHAVDLPLRPHTLTVVGVDGKLCRVDHVAGQEAVRYVRACADPAAAPADWAWVAQPDGRIDRFGIALWNSDAQDLPAPGAWIWAPPRDAAFPGDFAQKLITFLSSQGPAPDHGVAPTAATVVQSAALVPGGASAGLNWSSVVSGMVDPPVAPAPGRDAQISPALMTHGRSRSLMVTASDWGGVGLMQTPSARMRDAGSFVFHYNRVEPYSRFNVMAQPFEWMEAGFRYTAVANRLFGPANLSGDQSYKDKAFDVKFTLWDENDWQPATALGFRDIAGTGLFSGEYLVASKRFGDFDASLGIGWGNLASVSRTPAPGSLGGEFKFSNFFSGTPKAFGGVQWNVPGRPLVLKAEYEGNNYQNEPLGNSFSQKSHFNFGFTYRVYNWLDVTAGVERGNRFNIGLTLHSNLARHSVPKLHDAPRIPVAPTRPLGEPDWAGTAKDLTTQTNWNVSRIQNHGAGVTVTVDEPRGTYWQDRVDRAASVLHRDAPVDVDRFVLRYRAHGVDLAEQVIDREDWVAAQVQLLPPSRQGGGSVIAREARAAPEGKAQFDAQPAGFESNFRIGYSQNLGGPDGFVLYQIYAEQSARLRLGRSDTWLSGALQLRLIDNYDKFRYTAPSNLPRVRTFLREYLTTADLTLSHLQATHVRKVSDNQFVSVYGGYLEEMFGGFGGEWLYRPFASRFAYGVDVNVVRQRDFRQNFTFRDPAYEVKTGHATAYWDTGWNGVEMRFSAGRYLAGDWGGTVEAAKRFSNGVVFGAFATKTDVSAQQFGEGSFDKGIFLGIPFDALFTRSTGTVGYFAWKPLTRDGGAKLARRESLYDITRTRDLHTFELKPAPPPEEQQIPADRQPKWQPEAQTPAAHAAVAPRVAAKPWTADGDMALDLTRALDRQGFRNVTVAFDPAHRLNLKLAHDRLQPLSRAVGRAARTALAFAPTETREIRIQLSEQVEPLVEYDFFDLPRLRRYMSGELPAAAMQDAVAVRYLNAGARMDDPLAGLADVSVTAATPKLKDVVPNTYVPTRVLNDFSAAAEQAGKADWLKFASVGLATIAASSALDERGLRFAKDHAGSSWLKGLNRTGNALPWIGLAGAGLLALDTSDPRRSRTGYAAVEAGAVALVAATGLKYAVGRPRPNTGLNRNDLELMSGDSRRDAFPSRHSAVAWAVATPFALEYRAPWLYGVAALTNLSRVGKQKHWFSDTVAGSVLGYGLGYLFWEASRANSSMPQVFVEPDGVGLSWKY